MTTHSRVTADEAATILEALENQEPEHDAVNEHMTVLRSILGNNRGQFQADFILAHGFLLLAELLERQHQENIEVQHDIAKSLDCISRDA